MFETVSDISAKDSKSQIPLLNNENLSLPTILRKPVSRGEPSIRKQLNERQKLMLPNIYQSQADILQSNQTDRDRQILEMKNKTQFAREVKEKLNLVLGEMHVENYQAADEEDSDDFDFQAKINQNKQLIKMHKLKKQSEKNNLFSQRQKPTNQSKQRKQPKQRNQSLYEKRVKQYRDQSTENKYLVKRKQTVKEQKTPTLQDENIQQNNNIKQSRQIQDTTSRKDEKHLLKKSKQKSEQRALSHKASLKNVAQLNKNTNLFDSIQNYLQNPHQNKREGPKQLVGLTLLKAKRDIQDKIKLINQKLGLNQNQQQIKKQKIILDLDSTSKDWRRIQINYKKIDFQNSNFDKQLERIGSLQQRNSLNLQKYLQHQKILLQLELRKGQLANKFKANSQ